MKSQFALLAALAIFHTSGLVGQEVPIYQVTVIERTVKAVNYQYRGGPTQIDFRGTVLMPEARGTAVVESKRGRTELDAKFSHLSEPSRYGKEYLTYVLWAITPEGHARNLGEVVANSSDNGHLLVTTDLQAFGLIVTAEPYSAVRQPSDVVVMENEIRPDTIGRIEPIKARYELLPRGHYTYQKPTNGAAAEGPKVSMDRYESLLELYQAQNAVQIAAAHDADRYAPDLMAKAKSLLAEAQQMEGHKAGRSSVVTIARQAAQTAEDARTVAVKRSQESELAATKAALQQERERREAAEAEARQAKIEVSEQRSKLAEERAAREQTEQAAAMPPPPPPNPTEPLAVPVPESPRAEAARKTEHRLDLLRRLNGFLPAMDSPRGLVITLPNSDFRNEALDPAVAARVAHVGAILGREAGLSVEVEGHTDSASAESEQASQVRAEVVRDAMVKGGMTPSAISSRGLGNSRPLVSNSGANREQNRRVEIVVSGGAIGALAAWDRTYNAAPSGR
jgi:outer membrane protein OmpA-like peptidoglycan-associated protein